MKTLVSVITGRKDYPIFDTDSTDRIVNYLRKTEIVKVNKISDYEIETDLDEFRVIDVEIVKL